MPEVVGGVGSAEVLDLLLLTDVAPGGWGSGRTALEVEPRLGEFAGLELDESVCEMLLGSYGDVQTDKIVTFGRIKQ